MLGTNFKFVILRGPRSNLTFRLAATQRVAPIGHPLTQGFMNLFESRVPYAPHYKPWLVYSLANFRRLVLYFQGGFLRKLAYFTAMNTRQLHSFFQFKLIVFVQIRCSAHKRDKPRNQTTLSSHIWKLKDRKIHRVVNWSIKARGHHILKWRPLMRPMPKLKSL